MGLYATDGVPGIGVRVLWRDDEVFAEIRRGRVDCDGAHARIWRGGVDEQLDRAEDAEHPDEPEERRQHGE